MNQRKLLTINQLAKICSTSRATLLRMEKDEILSPVYTNPDNGYRYYDASSVLRVFRNLSLQELGITHKDLRKYYSNKDNYAELLDELNSKMAIMEYHIINLRLRLHKDEHLSISEFSFPEVYCYCTTLKHVTDLSTISIKLWEYVHEAIQNGYSLDRRMHPFIMVDIKGIVENNFQNIGYDYDICIPVIPEKGLNNNVVKFSSATTLSTILYGGSDDIQAAFSLLSEQLKQRNIPLIAKAMVIPVVRSFPGEEIPKEYWVSRVCIPLE